MLKNIEDLENKHKLICNPKLYKKLLEVRKNLDNLETDKTQQRIIYLKQKYGLRTPKSLKQLPWKVNTRRNLVQIHAIKDVNRVKRILTSDILNTFREYYSTLYSTSYPNITKIKNFFN